jgi:hypothetical protein
MAIVAGAELAEMSGTVQQSKEKLKTWVVAVRCEKDDGSRIELLRRESR